MHNERVLFLEDDRICAAATCASLRDYGCNVVETHNAAEAYAIIDEHPSLTALVTDINLGPGEDGFATARYARAAYPGLSVIYTSALNILRYAAERVPGSEFITKPFETSAIVRALSRVHRFHEVS